MMHASLDRGHYQLLLAIRDTGKLATAAARLSISSSAASHRLSEAERRTGVPLTQREGRSMVLTEAGLHLANAAAVTEPHLQSAEESAAWIHLSRRPAVRYALDYYDAVPWITALAAADDPFGLEVVRVPADGATSAVERRMADIAVVATAQPPDDPTWRPLSDDTMVAAVHVDHEAARRGCFIASDIASSTHITVGSAPRRGLIYEHFFRPHGVVPGRYSIINSLGVALRLVSAGRGACFGPTIAHTDLPPGVVTVPFDEFDLTINWYAVHRPDASEAVASVVGRLRDELTKLRAATRAHQLPDRENPT